VRYDTLLAPAEEERDDEGRTALRAALLRLEPVDSAYAAVSAAAELETRLSWSDPHSDGAKLLSKTTVTELKRLDAGLRVQEDDLQEPAIVPGKLPERKPVFRRPRFLEERKLTAAERGTVYHAVMQFLPLQGERTVGSVPDVISNMVERKLLTPGQAESVNPRTIEDFLASPIGSLLLQAERVYRELPFSFGLKAGELQPIADPVVAEETVLIQGVIDCLFDTPDGLVLLDYKTDATEGKTDEELSERYRVQLSLYAKAIESIWRRPIVRKVLYFFDGGRLIELQQPDA
jgi:ATP-dependent helicase/nuclease subunit A